ncbi:MAG TPA: bifunctional aldolase/short-chain dehydrogenase [Pseudolabrys sp.]|jgi:rhamnose utilization protein RhaD (predicted bifunctional aldolase and dehydrogenase)/NAD(P)-dependent dehydrogenase (short-subunit alcohol dehydrogenase family)|nr:bifunctional aldolase/short-chain dehydrogenase [Pseudolabrys sp.]
MRNLWSDRDARAAVKTYRAQGANEDLALRTYTTRLLGGDPQLVQHGGGNTSVKTVMRDPAGEPVKALCVKGSGWDMATIEPPGLPAVRLTPLLKLAALKTLSDEEMVAVQRGNLLDSAAPNPSVETLLHAFIPHKFVDHTHANAVLALCDRPDGMALCRKVYGSRVAIVPYVMPGFALALKAKEIFDAHPECEGLILHKHGIFTFGDSAREAYDRMIDLVSRAERTLRKMRPRRAISVKLPRTLATATDIAPVLRGLVSKPGPHFVLAHRANDQVLGYVNGRELARYSRQGPVTPDHVIRTKPRPLILPVPDAGRLDAFAKAARKAVERYQADYRRYFARHNARAIPKKRPLDAMPRVILVPGVGLFGAGMTAKDASIAADIAETTISVIANAERGGRFESISERDQFDIEYWSLEQAKLAGRKPQPLQGQVVVITGGAGTIGLATGAAFRARGAEVALLDVDATRTKLAARSLNALGVGCNVTDPQSVATAFDAVIAAHGGVDIVISNAGAAWQGRIGDVDDVTLRKSFELNFFAHQYVAQAAVQIMRRQVTGGALLFNVSKQAINPGPDFGPYGLPKAATLALMRQYAVDHGGDGITSNAVNADRIRSGLLTGALIKKRAKARGMTEHDYLAGNLLGQEVLADDVGEAFVSLALARKTTGAVLTVDGGNIAAAPR